MQTYLSVDLPSVQDLQSIEELPQRADGRRLGVPCHTGIDECGSRIGVAQNRSDGRERYRLVEHQRRRGVAQSVR